MLIFMTIGDAVFTPEEYQIWFYLNFADEVA
jgi:hypothetical protein